MYEWDNAAYQRKFGESKCLCQIEGEEKPTWRNVYKIYESGEVYLLNQPKPAGEAVFECNKGGKLTDLPTIEFFYAPIRSGVYGHLTDPNAFYLIKRNHVKSFKVGLGVHNYQILLFSEKANYHGIAVDHRQPINMNTHPIVGFKNYHAISNCLVARENRLEAYGRDIGFVEGNRVVLNSPHFAPIIQPYLEDKWQIVNL
jgi:hypothetical protein